MLLNYTKRQAREQALVPLTWTHLFSENNDLLHWQLQHLSFWPAGSISGRELGFNSRLIARPYRICIWQREPQSLSYFYTQMRFFLFCSCYKIDNNLFRNCISLELTVGYIFLDFFPFISPQKEMFPKEENLLISYIARGNTDELDYFDQVECHSVYQLEKKKKIICKWPLFKKIQRRDFQIFMSFSRAVVPPIWVVLTSAWFCYSCSQPPAQWVLWLLNLQLSELNVFSCEECVMLSGVRGGSLEKQKMVRGWEAVGLRPQKPTLPGWGVGGG